MIKPEGDKFRLYTRDGSRPLGPPETKDAAEAREHQVRYYSQLRKDESFTGVMLALSLPPEVAAKLVQPGGLPAELLHCTLAYLGRTENLPADVATRVRQAAAEVAANFGPVLGLIGGVGRFNPSPTSDGLGVVHATLDAPILPALREALCAELEAAGIPCSRDHGFDPHITLLYETPVEGNVQAPALPTIPSMPVVFQVLTVAVGETRTDVPLVGTRIVKMEPEPSEEEIEKAAVERYGVRGAAALVGAVEQMEMLLAKGVSERPAISRIAWEIEQSGLPSLVAFEAAEEALRVSKAGSGQLSPEFLGEAWKLVQEKCPPWVVAAIRDTARPRSGASARARSREEAASAAPGYLERMGMRGVHQEALAGAEEKELRGVWQQLARWHGGATKRGEKAEDIVSAARHLAGEMKRRKLELEPGELIQALAALGDGAAPEKVMAKVLKALALADKQIVYGVVLDPYMVDAHQDWTPPAEVEATAHAWMEKYRKVPLLHPPDPGYMPNSQAVVVESWVEAYPSREDYAAAMQAKPHAIWRRQFGDDMVHSGTWLLGVRLPAQLWAAYQKDEIAAFSIEGFGIRSPSTRTAMPKVEVVDLMPRK